VAKDTCQICKYKSELWALEQFPIIPPEVTKSAGVKESRTVLLCCSCRQELEEWYLAKVSNVVYDTMIKRFREKSFLEMIKEYEYAYHSFAEYKKGAQRLRLRDVEIMAGVTRDTYDKGVLLPLPRLSGSWCSF